MKIRQIALISILVIFLVACDAGEYYYENEGDESENEPYVSQEEIEPDQDTNSSSEKIYSGETDIPLPPEGYVYHGAFPGGITDWGEEDDMTPDDLHSYEEYAGKPIAWLYFSHNWFRDREFPFELAGWIRDDGSIPFIRLMLRSDAEQYHREPLYTPRQYPKW